MSITATCSMGLTIRADDRIIATDKITTQKIPIGLDIALELPCTTEIGCYLAEEIMKELKSKIIDLCVGDVEHSVKRYKAMVSHGLQLPDTDDFICNAIKPE